MIQYPIKHSAYRSARHSQTNSSLFLDKLVAAGIFEIRSYNGKNQKCFATAEWVEKGYFTNKIEGQGTGAYPYVSVMCRQAGALIDKVMAGSISVPPSNTKITQSGDEWIPLLVACVMLQADIGDVLDDLQKKGLLSLKPFGIDEDCDWLSSRKARILDKKHNLILIKQNSDYLKEISNV